MGVPCVSRRRHSVEERLLGVAVHKYDNLMPGTQLNNQLQAKVITRVEASELSDAVVAAIPGLREMLAHALDAAGPGSDLLYLDVLCQRSHSRHDVQPNRQAEFSWHQDTEEGRGQRLTLVYLLSHGRSSMCVAGNPEFEYGGMGVGALFPSVAWHRSGFASPNTLKVALFFT